MAISKTEELVVAAFQLSKTCPREWEVFLKALDAYVAETVKKLVASEPATLSNYQGQAVQATHIFNLFADARKTVQNAERMRNLKKPAEKSQWPSS